MNEMNEVERPQADEPRLSLMINRYDFAMASKAIAGYVEKGYGLDGMPLQRGQSPLSRPREPKNQGGGSGNMTLEEQRAGAISGRAWKVWNGPEQETRAEPGPAELAAENQKLKGDVLDLKATNAKLGAALRNLKADNEKLRAMCGAVLEAAYGADWKEQLKGVMNDGEHDDPEGNDGASQGE